MNTINSVNFNSKNSYNNPSFGSIKSIKSLGLYKKYPNFTKELVDSFMANDKAMTFCKKYDVDLVFASRLDSNFVYSDFVMFVDNISKGKLRKFLDALNAKQDRIHLTSVSHVWDKNEGLELSTSYLKHYFSDESGVLNSHMKLKDEEIQTVLAKKIS